MHNHSKFLKLTSPKIFKNNLDLNKYVIIVNNKILVWGFSFFFFVLAENLPIIIKIIIKFLNSTVIYKIL